LIVHLASVEELPQVVASVPPEAAVLARRFWPGPLTLVLPRKEEVPLITTGGLETVAVRVPDHPLALELIRRAGVPVAGPSANLSGRPSPTTAAHVLEDLQGKVDVIIDGGPTGLGVESTVLDLTASPPVLLRPGGVTWEALEEVLGKVTLDPAILAKEPVKEGPVRSPGMKYRHYAPKAKVYLVAGQDEDRIADRGASLAEELAAAAARIRARGPQSVVVEDAPSPEGRAVRVFDARGKERVASGPAQSVMAGAGSIFSAALTAALARGDDVREGARFAARFLDAAIGNARMLGKGLPVAAALPVMDCRPPGEV